MKRLFLVLMVVILSFETFLISMEVTTKAELKRSCICVLPAKASQAFTRWWRGYYAHNLNLLQAANSKNLIQFKELLTHPATDLNNALNGSTDDGRPLWLSIRLTGDQEWNAFLSTHEDPDLTIRRDNYAQLLRAVSALDGERLTEILPQPMIPFSDVTRSTQDKHTARTPIHLSLVRTYEALNDAPTDEAKEQLLLKSTALVDLLLKTPGMVLELQDFALARNLPCILRLFLSYRTKTTPAVDVYQVLPEDPLMIENRCKRSLLGEFIYWNNFDAVKLLVEDPSIELAKLLTYGGTTALHDLCLTTHSMPDARFLIRYLTNRGAPINSVSQGRTPLDEELGYAAQNILELLACGALTHECSLEDAATQATIMNSYTIHSSAINPPAKPEERIALFPIQQFLFAWAVFGLTSALAHPPTDYGYKLQNENDYPKDWSEKGIKQYLGELLAQHAPRLETLAVIGDHAQLGITSLMWAAARGRLDLIEFLTKDLGAPVDAQDEQGDTALNYAVRNRHVEAARYLLNRGARSLLNREGLAPLRLAQFAKQQDMLGTLTTFTNARYAVIIIFHKRLQFPRDLALLLARLYRL